jgi:hypothetical protein
VNVGELIDLLRRCPEEAPVVVQDAGGLAEATLVRLIVRAPADGRHYPPRRPGESATEVVFVGA